ncbi:hypothetical protein ETH_00037820, partial [Eimeria tenella]
GSGYSGAPQLLPGASSRLQLGVSPREAVSLSWYMQRAGSSLTPTSRISAASLFAGVPLGSLGPLGPQGGPHAHLLRRGSAAGRAWTGEGDPTPPPPAAATCAPADSYDAASFYWGERGGLVSLQQRQNSLAQDLLEHAVLRQLADLLPLYALHTSPAVDIHPTLRVYEATLSRLKPKTIAGVLGQRLRPLPGGSSSMSLLSGQQPAAAAAADDTTAVASPTAAAADSALADISKEASEGDTPGRHSEGELRGPPAAAADDTPSAAAAAAVAAQHDPLHPDAAAVDADAATATPTRPHTADEDPGADSSPIQTERPSTDSSPAGGTPLPESDSAAAAAAAADAAAAASDPDGRETESDSPHQEASAVTSVLSNAERIRAAGAAAAGAAAAPAAACGLGGRGCLADTPKPHKAAALPRCFPHADLQRQGLHPLFVSCPWGDCGD